MELDCGVSGKNITWYFKHLADDTYHAYPFQFCSSTGCGLEDGDTVLVVKSFIDLSTGDYICVDGQYGSGFTVGVGKLSPKEDYIYVDGQYGSGFTVTVGKLSPKEDYICVDGQYGSGFTVSVGRLSPKEDYICGSLRN